MSAPYNVIKASDIAGVTLDCVVSPYLANTGKTATGGTATDNTTAINNALLSFAATGSGSVKLILDGGTATSGLVLPSVGNYEIEGIGWTSGIYVIAGSNHDAIQNGIPYTIAGFQPTGAAPAQGGSIRLSNFTINGNRGNGTNGNSNSGNPRGIPGVYFYCNIALYGVKGLRIEDMFIYDSPTYSVRFINCSDVGIDNNSMINPVASGGPNGDCIHFGGPWSDVRVTNNYLNNNFSDDAIAFNGPEGYLGGANGTRVVITGNTIQNCFTALRVYGGTAALIGPVIFSNNTGNLASNVLIIGNGFSAADASGRSLIVTDNTFQLGANFILIADNLGDVLLDNNVWDSPTAAGSFISGTGFCIVSNLTVTNCRIYRTTLGSNTSTPLLSSDVNFTVTRMTIDNFQVLNEQGQSYAAVANLLSLANTLTISRLLVNSLDMTNITKFADTYATVTSMTGYGLGSQALAKTAAYTVQPTDGTIFVDATGGAVSITLPTVKYAGHEIKVVKTDASANAVTLVGTISGATNPTLAAQYNKARFETSGAVWYNV